MANYDVELNIPGEEKCFDFLCLAPYARTTRHEEAFLPKGKDGLGRFAPSALPHYKHTLPRLARSSRNELQQKQH